MAERKTGGSGGPASLGLILSGGSGPNALQLNSMNSMMSAGGGGGGGGGGHHQHQHNNASSQITSQQIVSRPVPMKLFATWEVDRTPSNCIPRWVLRSARIYFAPFFFGGKVYNTTSG
ncbi:hypothetical protein TKK_0018364 [Trichogramma kaykai]